MAWHLFVFACFNKNFDAEPRSCPKWLEAQVEAIGNSIDPNVPIEEYLEEEAYQTSKVDMSL